MLDTSGAVANVHGTLVEPPFFVWSDLDAFTQGYIEALFAGIPERDLEGFPRFRTPHNDVEGVRVFISVGFDDLAPETLARIIADCERWRAKYPPGEEFSPPNHARADGAYFWRDRNQGLYAPDFPPLTPHLGDDGRVYLREATNG